VNSAPPHLRVTTFLSRIGTLWQCVFHQYPPFFFSLVITSVLTGFVSALVSPAQFNGHDSEVFLDSFLSCFSWLLHYTHTRFTPHVGHSSQWTFLDEDSLSLIYAFNTAGIWLPRNAGSYQLHYPFILLQPLAGSSLSLLSRYPSYYFFSHFICVSCIRCIYRKGFIISFSASKLCFFSLVPLILYLFRLMMLPLRLSFFCLPLSLVLSDEWHVPHLSMIDVHNLSSSVFIFCFFPLLYKYWKCKVIGSPEPNVQ